MSSEELWYQYFKNDSQQSLMLLGVYGLRSAWATVGIACNLAIVYITIVSKSLHGICNVLILLESLFGIFQDASYYVSFVVYMSGIKFITYQTCFPILIPLSVCGNSAQMSMVLTGADRLFCVLFPIWYKNRNKKFYMAFVCMVLVAYAIYQFTIYYIDFLQSDIVLISCSTHELARGRLSTLMYVNGLTLSGTLMTLYGLIWFLVFLLRPIAKTVNENNKKMIKSLVFIIGLNMAGVFIKGAMSVVFANYWKVDVFVTTPFAIGMSFLTIAVYSANAPVLYVISSEYRANFRANFKWLPKMCEEKAPNAVNPATSTIPIQPQQHLAVSTNSNVAAAALFTKRANTPSVS